MAQAGWGNNVRMPWAIMVMHFTNPHHDHYYKQYIGGVTICLEYENYIMKTML